MTQQRQLSIVCADSAPSKLAVTRQRILRAAAETFRAKGYVATTINDIADAAGIRSGSLYYHFASKEQLLEEVLNLGMDRVHAAVVDAIRQLPEDAAWLVRLQAAVTAHLETLLENDVFTSANIRIFGQVPEHVQKRHLRKRETYADIWREILRGAVRSGEIRADLDSSLVRMLLLGALNWAVEWYHPRGLSAHDIARQAFEIMIGGLRAKPG